MIISDNDNRRILSIEAELKRKALEFIEQLGHLKASFARLDDAVQKVAQQARR
jgi:hypothetical protein